MDQAAAGDVEQPSARADLATSLASSKTYTAPPAEIIGACAFDSTPSAPVEGDGEPDASSRAPEGGSDPGPTTAPSPAMPPAVMPAIDPARLRHTALAEQVDAHLCAYEQAIRSGDPRQGTVALFSALETVLFDHVLVYREHLGVSSDPSTWKLEGLMLELFGDRYRGYLTSLIQG